MIVAVSRRFLVCFQGCSFLGLKSDLSALDRLQAPKEMKCQAAVGLIFYCVSVTTSFLRRFESREKNESDSRDGCDSRSPSRC